MIIQKGLYVLKITATTEEINTEVQAKLQNIFTENRSKYTSQYRIIDGAIDVVESINKYVTKRFPSFTNLEELPKLSKLYQATYTVLYDICKLLDADKKDGFMPHILPIPTDMDSIENEFPAPNVFFIGCVKELLLFIKGVLKDSKHHFVFNDCINVANIIDIVDSDIHKIGDGRKNPIFGIDYNFKVISTNEEEQTNEPNIKSEPIAEVTNTTEVKSVVESKDNSKEDSKEESKIECTNNFVDRANKIKSLYDEIQSIIEVFDIKSTNDIVSNIVNEIHIKVNDQIKPLKEKANADYDALEKEISDLMTELTKAKEILENIRKA